MIRSEPQTPYLSITRISGDPAALVEGYRETAELMAQVGRDHGLIAHAAAPAADGLVIVNVWRSEEGAEAATGDARRGEVIRRHGLTPDRFRREHHAVEGLVLFP